MGGLVEIVTGLLNRRWLITTVLPVCGFAAALGAVVLSGTGWSEGWQHWRALGGEAKAAALLGTVVTVLTLAQLTALARPRFTGLLQGHWSGLPGGALLAARGARRQRDLRRSRPGGFPDHPVDDALVMPTRFGNVLRGAEVHPRGRYRIDGVTAWPRLYPVLPDAFRQSFASANAGLEQAVTFCGLGAVFGVVGGVLAAFLLPPPWPLVCLAAGAAVARLGYGAAVGAATAYGQLFRSAFDVHRRTLLEAMGLHPAPDYAAERRQWEALDQLWAEGTVDSDRASALGYAPFPAGRAPDRTATRPAPEPAPEPRHPPEAAPLHPGIVPAAALAVLAGALTAAGLWSPPREPVRAVGPLAAYHQIAADDLRGVGRTALVGRYLLRPAARNAEVRTADLGPALPPGRLSGRQVFLLSPSGPGTAAVHRGATVTALLVPGREAPARVFPDLLVLDVRAGSVVLAVGGPDPTGTIAALSGDGDGVRLVSPAS
ncbi:hypothetical protein [Streptomyces sp. NBC_00158]|uniref:hypothetical protein n=1 Tax=Streptomyces sp. NBC_00158 TaxID=2903627 RepID=UPI002F90F1C3